MPMPSRSRPGGRAPRGNLACMKCGVHSWQALPQTDSCEHYCPPLAQYGRVMARFRTSPWLIRSRVRTFSDQICRESNNGCRLDERVRPRVVRHRRVLPILRTVITLRGCYRLFTPNLESFDMEPLNTRARRSCMTLIRIVGISARKRGMGQ
jgi:hypothetical protein